jgi:hypothetical protein
VESTPGGRCRVIADGSVAAVGFSQVIVEALVHAGRCVSQRADAHPTRSPSRHQSNRLYQLERTVVSEQSRSRPTNIHARERLREAQAAEARALKAVCRAETALIAARNKRDESIAKADAAVSNAEKIVAATQAELVGISGLDRAARLLAHDKTVLRKTISAGADHAG